MGNHVPLRLLTMIIVLSVSSCGTGDEAASTPPATDASVDSPDAPSGDAGGQAGEAGGEAALPDASGDAPADAPADALSDNASPGDAVTDGNAEAGSDLFMTFQHSAGLAVAAWNADGTGPEPQKSGYAIPAPYASCMPVGSAVSLAYVASGDYDGIVPSCPGAVKGDPSVAPLGFANFTAELVKFGKTLDGVVIRFAPIVLQSPDAFPGSPEHRVYKTGAFQLWIDNEPMVSATSDTVEMTVDYMDGNNCNDDVVTALANELVVADDSAASSAPVKALASAFVADVAGRKVRLRFQGFQAMQAVSAMSKGRTGAVFTVGGGAQLDLSP